MLEKNHLAVVVLVIVLILPTALMVPEAAFAISGPSPPDLYLEPKPKFQNIQAGSSATFRINVYPLYEWKIGNITFSLLNPPQGVTATFSPEKMTIIQFQDTNTSITVKVAADTPLQGNVTLIIQGTGLVYQTPFFGRGTPLKINSTTNLVLNITAPSQKIIVTTDTTSNTTLTTEEVQTQTVTSTSAVTQTSTLTTTLTSITTLTSTEQATDPSTYAWAVSATVAAVVLAVVLLLQRRVR